jgi:hypothetical protein
MHRVTASVLHSTSLGADGQWATAVIWGANIVPGQTNATHSVLVESEAILDPRNTFLGRAEYVQKSASDLVLDTPAGGFAMDRTFDISTLTLGYIREIGVWRGTTIGLGALGTANFIPATLQDAYGSRIPLGAMVFLRVRVRRAPAGTMKPMPHMEGMNHAQP